MDGNEALSRFRAALSPPAPRTTDFVILGFHDFSPWEAQNLPSGRRGGLNSVRPAQTAVCALIIKYYW